MKCSVLSAFLGRFWDAMAVPEVALPGRGVRGTAFGGKLADLIPVASASKVPSNEKCTWDRQKLKMQIERGTMCPGSCFDVGRRSRVFFRASGSGGKQEAWDVAQVRRSCALPAHGKPTPQAHSRRVLCC